MYMCVEICARSSRWACLLLNFGWHSSANAVCLAASPIVCGTCSAAFFWVRMPKKTFEYYKVNKKTNTKTNTMWHTAFLSFNLSLAFMFIILRCFLLLLELVRNAKLISISRNHNKQHKINKKKSKHNNNWCKWALNLIKRVVHAVRK